jgi:hypothetical protein
MDMPVNVPIDNPNADTEWNDILRKHGIIPEKPPDPEPIIQDALISAAQRAHETRLEDKTLDELDALEDEEDDAFLSIYRQKRLAELGELARKGRWGSVLPLQKAEYAREVTEASNSAFVVVAMTGEGGNVESRVLSELLVPLSAKYPDVKFMSIPAPLCIPHYPEKNTPTLLIYKDTQIVRQVVTLGSLNGVRTNLRNLELLLVEIGAVMEGDSRLQQRDGDDDLDHGRNGTIRVGGKKPGTGAGEDDDWD